MFNFKKVLTTYYIYVTIETQKGKGIKSYDYRYLGCLDYCYNLFPVWDIKLIFKKTLDIHLLLCYNNIVERRGRG